MKRPRRCSPDDLPSRKAEPRLDDPAWVASEEGQSYLEAWKVARRRERRLERVPS